MNKIISWVLGLAIGGTIGALLVMLLVPYTREEITSRLKTGYQEALEEARNASQQRREELESKLSYMQQQRQVPDSTKR